MSALLKRRNIFFNLLLSLLITLPAFIEISCRKLPSPLPEEEEPAVADSTLTRLHLQNSSKHLIRDVQILVYKSEGTRELEKILLVEELSDSIEFVSTAGEKLLVAVANYGKALSPVSLGRYDSLSELGFDFSDEDFEYPVMSGECSTLGNKGEISLVPLLCTVEIESISNTLEDYELLGSPRVRLAGINGYASLMQTGEFYPTEIIDYGQWEDLPYDVGMFTQYPGTELYCYPNQTSETSIGGTATSLELECEILGELCDFKIALPPFGRGSRLLVEITVDGPDSYTSRVSVERPSAT